MKKLLGLVVVVMVVIIALSALQTCNVPALQAQAMIEMAHANEETAKAAQAAANSANTLAWTLGGAVALIAVGLLALIGLLIFIRVRRELQPQAEQLAQQPRISLPRQPQQPQLVSGDPIQQLIQLQTLQMLQGMNQHPAQLPAPRAVQNVSQDQTYEW